MFTEIQGKKLYYEIDGAGDPILMVHGWGGSSNSLRKLSVLLSKKYKTILVDLPGFGKSDNPEAEWGTAEYAHVLVKLLDELKVKRVNYVGHSFGGSIGIYLAATKPEIIDKLVLMAPSFKRPAKKVFGIQFLKQIVPAPLKLVLYRIFFPRSDISRYLHLEKNFRRIVKEDLTSYLSEIKAPTLILWGELDTYVPVTYAQILHGSIKNSRLKLFKNIRHSLPLHYPELAEREIAAFLK